MDEQERGANGGPPIEAGVSRRLLLAGGAGLAGVAAAGLLGTRGAAAAENGVQAGAVAQNSGVLLAIKIRGAQSGVISGGATDKWYGGGSRGYKFEYRVAAENPRYDSSPPDGPIDRSVVTVTKEWDKASPKLLKLLLTGESLTVDLVFGAANPQGMSAVVAEVLLTGAQLIEFTPYIGDPTLLDEPEIGGSFPQLETLAFSFQTMKYTVKTVSTTDSIPGGA